ncbi:hypothetical protein GRF29_44g1526207 [Pseudopithomyces chartarum]|uniref:EngB-type G domain-containing protein n=1 Tax=Pseudopithomyces chartarum TaxID=1892770 RepID=A0AAN6M1E4_9PLEO|nr:hypothetical protein GRF29_44g1526207 [Pseudopithomyces chartarum]
MTPLAAAPRYLCRNCFEAVARASRPSCRPPVHAPRRHKSTASDHATDASNFRIAKHYGDPRKSDRALDAKDKPHHGQYAPPSGKRIPTTQAPTALPRARKLALPGPPPAHVPVQPRKVTTVARPLLTPNIKKPSSIHRRQLFNPMQESGTGGFGFLQDSDHVHEGKPPVKIPYPEKPMTHTSLHFSNLQDWNWYWETIPPTMAQKTQAQHFFTKKASPRFLQSVAFFRAFPESDVPEVAFVGRSNVGKSSLLNAIVNADTKALLARTSSTPGFTKTMNLYGLGPTGGVNYKKQPSGHGKIVGPGGVTIVDMPGYGEGSISEWGIEILKYLQGRKQLRRVFMLIDAQHGIKDKDRSLLASLRLGGIPHQVILSKLDKLYLPDARSIKRSDGKRLDKLKSKGTLEDLRKTMDRIRSDIQPSTGGGALGEILACSSEVLVDERRLGIDAVRFAILQAIGFAFRTDQHQVERAMKNGPTIKTVKTNVPMRLKTVVEENKAEIATVVKLTSDALDEVHVSLSAKERRAARRAGRR